MIELNIPTRIEGEADLVRIEAEITRARKTLRVQGGPKVGQVYESTAKRLWCVTKIKEEKVTLMCLGPLNKDYAIGAEIQSELNHEGKLPVIFLPVDICKVKPSV